MQTQPDAPVSPFSLAPRSMAANHMISNASGTLAVSSAFYACSDAERNYAAAAVPGVIADMDAHRRQLVAWRNAAMDGIVDEVGALLARIGDRATIEPGTAAPYLYQYVTLHRNRLPSGMRGPVLDVLQVELTRRLGRPGLAFRVTECAASEAEEREHGNAVEVCCIHHD